jgi:hypothetical protein
VVNQLHRFQTERLASGRCPTLALTFGDVVDTVIGSECGLRPRRRSYVPEPVLIYTQRELIARRSDYKVRLVQVVVGVVLTQGLHDNQAIVLNPARHWDSSVLLASVLAMAIGGWLGWHEVVSSHYYTTSTWHTVRLIVDLAIAGSYALMLFEIESIDQAITKFGGSPYPDISRILEIYLATFALYCAWELLLSPWSGDDDGHRWRRFAASAVFAGVFGGCAFAYSVFTPSEDVNGAFAAAVGLFVVSYRVILAFRCFSPCAPRKDE